MRLLKYLLPLALVVLFTSGAMLAADEQDFNNFQEELNNRDYQLLRDYLNSKRTIDLQDKACNLTISGDVRSEWRHLCERRCHKKLRGGDAVDLEGVPLSRNDFDIEFNLRFDYICDRAWAVAHIQFDEGAGVDDTRHRCCCPTNDAGDDSLSDCECACEERGHRYRPNFCQKPDPQGWHGSGYCDNVCLKKAYFGYNICCEDDTRFDIEMGRRNLYNVFDSKIQFLSRFDGILLKYASSWECIADWYINLAGFVVDERVNHFAYVGEIGFLNIADWCIDLKYSIINWNKNGTNRCFVHNPKGFKFINSQWTLYYHFNPEYLCVPAQAYGAFLVNHNAPKISDHVCDKKQNYGWYAGFTLGQVCREGDWAFDARYEYVQAQAVPEYDVSGIGRGNVLNETLTSSRRGNTNYKGYRLEFLYALTDNLSFDTIWEWSREVNKRIGGQHHFSNFKVEAIYAF